MDPALPLPPASPSPSKTAGGSLLRLCRQLPGALCRVPVLGVLVQAVQRYIGHQSANQAGSVAFSVLLSMFPLLILASATAAYVGKPGDAVALATRVIGYAPQVVQDSLAPVVRQVLGQRSQALLAIGLLVTLWTASSGMQSVRTALNRAYGVRHGLTFWQARLKVTLFTVVVGAGVIAAFSSVVVMPYVWLLLARNVGTEREVPWLHDAVSYTGAFLVLTFLYALMYGWLPDIRQRLRTVLPGAVLGALLWVGAAALLSHTLRSAGHLHLVYGGFTGLVATLVFLYASATTLIFGAEVNGVLTERLAGARPRPEAAPPTGLSG